MRLTWLATRLVATALLLLPSAVFGEELLKIGSWNIEHLGEKTPAQNAKALAQHIDLGGPDILALQEIYDTDETDDLRNVQLDQTFAELNQLTGNDWQYSLVRKNDPEDQASRKQNLGVAWNPSSVQLINGPDRIDVAVDDNELPPEADAGSAPWRRPPYAWHFSAGEGKTDFVLINLHLKSNSDGEELGRAIRALEGRSLAERLEAVRQQYEERDVIVLGDTNCKNADEPALEALADAGLRDLNANDLATYISGDSPFDRFLVGGESDEDPQFRFSRQYALIATDRESHDRALSDHFMILMSMRILEDDD